VSVLSHTHDLANFEAERTLDGQNVAVLAATGTAAMSNGHAGGLAT
jgi:hypothetical protein